MPARNDITGDLIRTKAPSKKLLESIEPMSIEQRRSNKGRYKQCRETKRMIPIAEWNAKYGSEPVNKSPLIFCNHFEPFESPVTGRVIRSKREHQYDLDSTGSRVYEGREQETKEASKWQAEQETRLERDLEQTLSQELHNIEHGYRRVE